MAKPGEIVVHLSNQKVTSKSSMIVPVWVFHKDKPEHKVLIYALLDTQSDTTFIKESTCDKLGVHRVSTKLSLSTLHATDIEIQTSHVQGLLIQGLNCDVT